MKGLSWWRTFLLATLLALPALAQELSLEISMDDATGRPTRVVLRGETAKACWLGVSFYPYGTENALKDGEHQLIELAPGRFEHVLQVQERMVGGAVECALWDVRVARKDCSGPCEWCLENGYHVENRRIYLYGSLAPAI